MRYRASFGRYPYKFAWNIRFWRTLSFPYSAVPWVTTPITLLTARWPRPRRSGFMPKTRTVPRPGMICPVIAFIAVVFPHPLGPSSPKTVPAGMTKLSPLRDSLSAAAPG